MYREEHLNIKNSECNKLWHEWYQLFIKKNQEQLAPEKTGVNV